MATYQFEAPKATAKKIAKKQSMISVAFDTKTSFHASTDFSSVDFKNGLVTINDASCANASEVADKYNL